MGDTVGTEAVAIFPLKQSPLTLKEDIEERFIVELMFPAFRINGIDPFVDNFLAVFRVGMTADNTRIELKGIHLPVVLAVEADCQVCNAGIGPVVFYKITSFNLLRCVHALSQ